MGIAEQFESASRDVFVTLDRRSALFLSLPLASLNALALEKEVYRIGRE